MGFLSGSMTFERYWITNDPTGALGQEHLEVLEKHKIGAHSSDSPDQPNVGFLAGAHLLDTRFDLEKNIIGDALHFGIRIDTNQIPGPIRNAWLQMELQALAVDNPSGKPNKAQRQEAREAVEARCIDEAATGKYRRMQQVPVLWDAATDVLYLGGTSTTANELCIDLLERSFGLEFDRISSGKLAKNYAEQKNDLESLFQLSPASFQPDKMGGDVTWWNGMSENYDYLGNEFLLWLWWHVDAKSDTIRLGDDSEVACMFARTLTLDCPLGESGKETISAECPIALPESEQAIRSGKLPRKAGLTIVRGDQQFDLALQAESFCVGGAKFTQIGNAEKSENTYEDRVLKLRELTDTLDLMFDAFCQRRIGKSWKSEVKKMQDWLHDSTSAGRRKPAA
ncbi:MAG: hypothetical protein KDA92_23030 [Planctomycetales bacterium]|nr:hypothetical protein [Planctomycetales bacterium]